MIWGASNHQSVWWFKSADDIHWHFASVIASAEWCRALGITTEEGPNEATVTLLKDERTLLAVMQQDGGDGDPHKYHRPYLKSVSSTDGSS